METLANNNESSYYANVYYCESNVCFLCLTFPETIPSVSREINRDMFWDAGMRQFWDALCLGGDVLKRMKIDGAMDMIGRSPYVYKRLATLPALYDLPVFVSEMKARHKNARLRTILSKVYSDSMGTLFDTDGETKQLIAELRNQLHAEMRTV